MIDTLMRRGDFGTSLVVQWLERWVSTTWGPVSMLGRGSKIPQAMQCGPSPPRKKSEEEAESKEGTKTLHRMP